MLAIPRAHTIRQVKDDLAPTVLGQRRTLPEDTTCIDRQQSRDALQEGRLARAIRADQTKNFTAPDIKRNISERPLIAVPLGYADNLEWCCTVLSKWRATAISDHVKDPLSKATFSL
jgi:hypothetical protein